MAAATERVRIVLTLTLPRRQVQDVAQDTAGIAALAGGRLTVLGIIGSMDIEFTEFGLDPDLKARGRALDDRLVRLQELWRRWGAPEIPLWCGGRWPRKPGLRRSRPLRLRSRDVARSPRHQPIASPVTPPTTRQVRNQRLTEPSTSRGSSRRDPRHDIPGTSAAGTLS